MVMKDGTNDNDKVRVDAGVGWLDRSESPDVLAALADRVARQQETVASGAPALSGRIGRGQHQKQLLGALGKLSIHPSIPAAAAVGPFARLGEYKVACRISNGQPCPFHDQAPDVRGIALKFFTTAGVEADLVMTNEGGRSHARDAAQFTDVADLLAAFAARGGRLAALWAFARKLGKDFAAPAQMARAAAILGKETIFHRVESMTTEHYWGSVVKLGPAAIKYSVHPHSSTRAGTDADPRTPNYLRVDLLNRLGRGPIIFDLALQFFVTEDVTPVNDASAVWKAPLVPIGRVEIVSAPSRADEDLIDRMAFNPANGFEPLGITHVRKLAYATSARNRGALETEEVRSYLAGGT
jgi:catalase